MKTKLLAIALLCIGTIMSCNDESGVVDPVDKLQSEADVLRLTNVRNRVQQLVNSGVSQRSNSSGRQSESGRAATSTNNTKGRFAMAKAASDSTGWEDYESCATITETENADGSFTIVEDYGVDGCEEFGTLVKGKIIGTFSSKDGVENVETIYEGFSYDGMKMDGKMIGIFTWDINNKDSTDFSYSSNWKEELTISFESGEIYTIKSDFSQEYKGDKLVMKGSYGGKESNGDSFSSVISSPLVFDFSCDGGNIFVPVRGVESCTYNEEVFSIDYGSGACDNIATITENGESYTINFSDEGGEDIEG